MISDAEVLRLAKIGAKAVGGVVAAYGATEAGNWRPIIDRAFAGGVPYAVWSDKENAAFTAAVRAALPPAATRVPAVDPVDDARKHWITGRDMSEVCQVRVNGTGRFCTRPKNHARDEHVATLMCGDREEGLVLARWPVASPPATVAEPKFTAPDWEHARRVVAIKRACFDASAFLATALPILDRQRGVSDCRIAAELRHQLRVPSVEVARKAATFMASIQVPGCEAEHRSAVLACMEVGK